MMTKRKSSKPTAEKTVRDIRRATRPKYSADEKIRIVMVGIRAEGNIAELCCKEGISGKLLGQWVVVRELRPELVDVARVREVTRILSG